MNLLTTHTLRMFFRNIRLFLAILIVMAMTSVYALAIPALDLRSTSNFVILAGSTVTGIPPVSITGNVGLSPAAGSFIVGFDGSNVTGTLYVVDASGPSGSVINATLLQTAKSDLTIAYNDAAGRTPIPTGTFLNPGSSNIGGLNLVPGLYKFTSDAAITGSDLTLTGNSTDVWIFQISSSLNVGSGIHIILAGGAQAANIFWQVGTSATLGTYSVFKGTILADQSVSFGTGASIDGRALAFSAAVTMSSGVTTNKPVLTNAVFSIDSAQVRFGNVANGSTKKDTVTVTNSGNGDLVISSITSSNTKFTVTPTTATITAGSTRKFFITYSPVADGTQNGYIYFNHNGANSKDSIAVSGNVASPGFAVSPSSLNFGSLVNGANKKDSVTVTNNGTMDLIISSITSSNTKYTVTPITGTITPGSSRKYYVIFAPVADGLQNGHIYFIHNPANVKDSISVTGTGISPGFSVTPLSLDFGNVDNAITKNDSLAVKNTGTADLVISSITSTNNHFTTISTNTTITPGSTKKFYILFTPLSSGKQDDYIVFNYNSTNTKDSVHVTGTGVGSSVSPKFSATPLSLNFANVNSGTTKTDSVTVTNTGTGNLIIFGITSNNVYFKVNPGIATIAAGASQKFYFTFAPLIPGLQDGYVYFNHNAMSSIDSIHVSGTGIGGNIAPKFWVDKSNIDFGTVFVGGSEQISISVTNTGTSDLNISDIISTDIHYNITPISAIIGPGSSLDFFITFSPTELGQLNAKIIFKHNAGSDTINLTGKGIGAMPVITISAARDLPIGTDFSIEGIVTRTMGVYTRIQDETGAITIVQPSGVFFDEVQNSDIQMGDQVRVQGRISELSSLKVINSEDLTGFQRISRLNVLPVPVKVTLSDIAINGEQYESRLITVENLNIESDNFSTFMEAKTYQITDDGDKTKTVTIRIGNGTDTEMDGMPFIGTAVDFVGVLSQTSTSDPSVGYELTPVLSTDLNNSPSDVLISLNANQNYLSGNYPNPFNSTTTIQYSLGNVNFVSLKVYDELGAEVKTLVNGLQPAGVHTVNFDVSENDLSVGSSVYFYRLVVGTFISTKQMIIVK